ncbi:MAG: Ppx/GppA family phosphatase [Ignavibacteriae bacterium]|nr:Ppx/GppA family phosphatase [Ignavibacteriota bacterium]
MKTTNHQPKNLAAIDIGTNSLHLVVAQIDPKSGKFLILDREKEAVRLGSGATDMKTIAPDAMNCGIQTLVRFKAIAEANRATVRAVATSAVREALNQHEFVKRAKSEADISVEVISGTEESRLIYLGVLQALPVYDKRILLIDIGGGSTEFLVGEKRKVLFANSLKLGAIRLTQRFFSDGRSNGKQVKECRKYIRGMINPVVREIGKLKPKTTTGSSGTIQSIARIVKSLRGENERTKLNNFTFTAEELHDVVEMLLRAETPRQRNDIPGLDQSRSDIIVGGALILEQAMEDLHLRSITVSEYALREGVILDTIEKNSTIDPHKHLSELRYHNVLHLAERFAYERSHSHHVAKLALGIFDQIPKLHELGMREREFLEAAALLHEVGFFISHAQHHRHSYYLIRNAELFGFTDNEKEIIANIARYHRKSHPKPKHDGFSQLSNTEQQVVRKLASILRIADGLDRTHSSSVKDVRCRLTRGVLHITLRRSKRSTVDLELWGADRKKELFEQTYGTLVRFRAS